MKEAVFLLELLKVMLSASFGPDEAVSRLGRPVEKGPKLWRLRPRESWIREARLHFEDLEAGQGLLTTVEVEMQAPWVANRADLERALGRPSRWLPVTGPGRPRTLAFDFDKDGHELDGSILLRLDPPPKAGSGERLQVRTAMVRRFFPAPASKAEPAP